MKTLFAMVVATVSVLTTGAASAQNSNMMNGGAWGVGWMGDYGGMGIPLLLVIVAVGLVLWIVKHDGK